MKTSFRSALLAVCLLAASAPATNSAQASTLGSGDTATIRITAVVPVVCNLKLNPAPLRAEGKVTVSDTTVIDLGTMEVLCNSSQGYKIFADYSSNLHSADLIVDGKRTTLTPDGSVIASSSTGAKRQVQSLQLDISNLTVNPNENPASHISFRIQAN